jgi:choline dehydrogenase-like flavoprotein
VLGNAKLPPSLVAFIRSSDDVELPDIELIFGVNPPDSLAGDKTVGRFTTYVAHLQPRGTVRLASADRHDPPLIDASYLTNPRRPMVLIAGVRRALSLAGTCTLKVRTGIVTKTGSGSHRRRDCSVDPLPSVLDGSPCWDGANGRERRCAGRARSRTARPWDKRTPCS